MISWNIIAEDHVDFAGKKLHYIFLMKFTVKWNHCCYEINVMYNAIAQYNATTQHNAMP